MSCNRWRTPVGCAGPPQAAGSCCSPAHPQLAVVDAPASRQSRHTRLPFRPRPVAPPQVRPAPGSERAAAGESGRRRRTRVRKFEKAGSTATRFSPRRDALRMGERDPLPGSRCQVLGPGRAVSWEMPLQIPDLALWPALVVHLGAGLKRQAAKLPLAACRPCCRPRRGRRVGKAWRSSAEGGTGEDGRCTHSGRARPSRGLTVSRSDQAAATEAPGAGRRPEASPSRGRRVGGDAGAANSFPGGGSRGFPFRVGSESAKIGFPSGWSRALRFSESVSESRRGPSVAIPISRATRGPAAHSGRAGRDPDPAFQDNGDQVSRVTGPADNGPDDNTARGKEL